LWTNFHRVMDDHLHPIVGNNEGVNVFLVVKIILTCYRKGLGIWGSWYSNFYYYGMGKNVMELFMAVYILFDHLVWHTITPTKPWIRFWPGERPGHVDHDEEETTFENESDPEDADALFASF
jgi:hypothetical protein